MTRNILREYGISIPADQSVAMVIYCCVYYCRCVYIFLGELGEAELRQEEVWMAQAYARLLPPTSCAKDQLKEYLARQYPQAMMLKNMRCYDTDAPDVFEANACGYCRQLTGHPDECPSLLGEPLEWEVLAAGRVWHYGYKVARAGLWNGFIERVHSRSALVRLGYAQGVRDRERLGVLPMDYPIRRKKRKAASR